MLCSVGKYFRLSAFRKLNFHFKSAILSGVKNRELSDEADSYLGCDETPILGSYFCLKHTNNELDEDIYDSKFCFLFRGKI